MTPTPGHGATDEPALSERRSRTVESILTAAMLIVTHDGVAALSMSAIASKAGLSRQTLYGYFRDLDAVLAAMVFMGDTGTEELIERLRSETDQREAVSVFAAVAVEAAGSGHPSPAAITAALPAELRVRMQAHEERAEESVVELVRRGVEAGVFRADLDAELEGRILYRAAFAGAELARRPEVDPERLAERLSVDLLRMVESD